MAGAAHYTELTCWKLADALRVETLRFTQREPWASDFKARYQAEDAVDSICRNIAEGFGAETHRDFARYLRYSRKSLNELSDCLHSAQLKRYVNTGELAEAFSLKRRLHPALNNFIACLDRTPNHRSHPRANGTDTKVDRTDTKPPCTDKRKSPRTDY